jgi:hypothetical protein
MTCFGKRHVDILFLVLISKLPISKITYPSEEVLILGQHSNPLPFEVVQHGVKRWG